MAPPKKHKRSSGSTAGKLIGKLRKPMAPPTRVLADESKYDRARERALLRRAASNLK